VEGDGEGGLAADGMLYALLDWQDRQIEESECVIQDSCSNCWSMENGEEGRMQVSKGKLEIYGEGSAKVSSHTPSHPHRQAAFRNFGASTNWRGSANSSIAEVG
jgi:hypothetical protein